MARIAYDDRDAAAFEASRRIDEQGLTRWREAVTRHLDPRAGTRLLDLGSGTGMWARTFRAWYDGIDVIAVEPAEAMRARCPDPPALPGDAAAIPLADRSVDAAWLSNVIHHVPDLTAAAGELRRVVRPGGRALIRSAFAGGHQAITLFRFFPAAIRVLSSYPSVAQVEAAFAGRGFVTVAVERVAQVTAPSLRAAAANLRRAAHTPLQLISDDEYAAGLARLRRAAESESGPVIDALDLVVLQA